MRKFLIGLLFVFIICLFFYPVFKGNIPFPGDLLVSEYSPYNTIPFLGYNPGSFPNKAQDFDVLRLLYPAKEFSIESLLNYKLPLWNPYNFSGNPHLASLQSGTFYPLNLIFLLLPFKFFWLIYIISQPILTSIFTYLLLCELSLNRKSSIFGGLVFSFSSYQVVWMEYGNIGHSILWLPLAMWLSLKYLKKPSFLTWIVLIFSLSFSILAGYIQTTFYFFIFLFIFVIFNIFIIDKNNLLIKLLGLISVFLFSILLSSLQLLPTIELILQSARSAYSLSDYLRLLIPSYHIATLFAPDFFGNPATRNYWLSGTYIERVSYIGVIPIFFALYGLIRKPTKIIWFFAISIFFIVLTTFDTVFSRSIYTLFFPPFITTVVPTRIMFIFCFCVSILAAYGIDFLQKDRISKRFWTASISLISIYILLWIFVIFAPIIFPDKILAQNLKISLRNLIIPSGFFISGLISTYILLRYKSIKKYALVAVFILTIFDLFYFFQKITPFSPLAAVYPKTEVFEYLRKIQGINRSWGYGSGYIETNLQTHEKNFSTNGYDALHIKRYGELLTASKNGKIGQHIPGAYADLTPGYGEKDLIKNYYRKRILDLLGVKYIIHKWGDKNIPDEKIFPPNLYNLIWYNSDFQIYENKNSLPRIFLAKDYIVESDKHKTISSLMEKNLDLGKTIILEKPISSEFNLAKDENAKVFIQKYEPNYIAVRTQSKSSSLLFVSDNYFPGWKVNIDGKSSTIYRADYSFRAIPVLAGNHNIEMRYYPDSFAWGFRISLATFLSLLTYLFINIKKRR